MSATVSPSRNQAQAVSSARIRHPHWRDPRLIVGVVLALASVIGVTQIVASADDTRLVWAASTDLARGTTITSADVTAVAVKLADYQPYASADSEIAGAVTTRSIAAGELVSNIAVAADENVPTLRWITLPVGVHHLPADLARGEQVDVYLVERTASGEPAGEPKLVLEQVTVADVDAGDSRFGGGSLELGVALAVEPEYVASLVAAEARGTVTLVRVPVSTQ